jgi:hypothetical protein
MMSHYSCLREFMLSVPISSFASHYSCPRELTPIITTPSSFPPRNYWSHSMADRRVRYSTPEPAPRVRIFSDPVPSHVFQVACDTVSSSESCFQSDRKLNLVR